MSNIIANIPKIRKNTNKTFSAIAFIMILALSVFAVTVNTINVHAQTSTSSIPTYAFIAAEPNPVGVNQQVLVDFWLANPSPSANGPKGDRYSGFMVKITAPDGTAQSKGPFTADDESSAHFLFTPTQIGTYTFQFNYPGQTLSDVNLTFGSSSASVTLTVQQKPATSVQVSYPTSYWTRPINGMNYGWSSVSSNWLMGDWNMTNLGFDYSFAVDPVATVPSSAHVLWTQLISFGGIVGEQYGNAQFYDGRSYEQIFTPPVIISGRLYYNTVGAQEQSTSGDLGNLGITCVNMSSGQTLFTIPNATLSFGEIYNYISPNQAGAFAYLWSVTNSITKGATFSYGKTWKMYDAWTGNYILSIDNVPSGVAVYAPDGSILVYSLAYNATVQTYQLTLWNSTRAIQPNIDSSWEWRPYTYAGQTINGDNGIMWQVNEPNATGQTLTPTLPIQQVGLYDGDEILAFTVPTAASGTSASNFYSNILSNDTVEIYAYSMTNGAFLWNSTICRPSNLPNDLWGSSGMHGQFENNGVLYTFIKQTEQWVAYDVTTGKILWITQPYTNDPWGEYDYGVNSANGILYSTGYDGIIHAFNTTNGEPLWTFSSGAAGTLTPYGTWPFYNGLTIAGNSLIGTTGEHGNGMEPLYQGEAMYVLDATTGTLQWSMLGWFEQPSIADGILVTHNCADNQIYAFGKGPSATTVEAPMSGVTSGSVITIKGTVTDQSPGQAGTAAISDQNMSAWMAYLKEQIPLNGTVTGVPVQLTAVSSDGATINIGTVVSNMYGSYGISWTPPTQGIYEIIANFGGSNSYYSSTATTYLAVGPASSVASPAPAVTPSPALTSAPSSTAPSTSTTPTSAPSPSPVIAPAQGSSTETYIVVTAAVIIIASIAVVAFLLRRRH